MGCTLCQEIIDFVRGKETYFKKSFSQSGEDAIIWGLIRSLGLKNFSWLDIGAHHPLYLSNTASFYRKGFRGINIEGDPSLIKEFYRKRPKDINLNVLISSKKGRSTFYIIDPPTLNTMSEEEAKRAETQGHSIKGKIEVESMTVPDVLNKYCNGIFPDLLTLDAEGCDFDILKTIEWEKTTPKIICIESVPYTIGLQNNFEYMRTTETTKYILEKGYFIAAYTGINAIFVQEKFIGKY